MSHLRWSAWRQDRIWAAGWISDTGRWLSIVGLGDHWVLDVAHYRVRWQARRFRPLFSERFGHAAPIWRIGRLTCWRSRRTPARHRHNRQEQHR